MAGAARKRVAGQVDGHANPPADLLRQVDVLVVNEMEYEAILGTPLPEDHDQVAAVTVTASAR